MKNKKILIIVVIIAIVLIAAGTFFLLQPSTKKEKQEVNEIRNYQTVTQNEKDTMTKTNPTKDEFEEEAKNVGFEKTNCQNNNCIASNKGYSNYEYEDVINLTQEENGTKTFSTMLYFKKSEFTVDNIYQKLSSVTNNYFGTEATKEQLQEVLNGLKNSTNNFYQNTYISGTYTIEINMQNVVGKDFRLVKYLVQDTNLYNQYHNVG